MRAKKWQSKLTRYSRKLREDISTPIAGGEREINKRSLVKNASQPIHSVFPQWLRPQNGIAIVPRLVVVDNEKKVEMTYLKPWMTRLFLTECVSTL